MQTSFVEMSSEEKASTDRKRDHGRKFLVFLWVALIGLCSFSFLNYTNTSSHKKQVNEIGSLYFPILKHLDGLMKNHNKLRDYLSLSGQKFSGKKLDDARSILANSDLLNDSINSLDPGLSGAIDEIRILQGQYLDIAIKIYDSSHTSDSSSLADDEREMKRLYDLGIDKLDDLKERQYWQVEESSLESAIQTDITMYLGFVISLLNVVVIAVLMSLAKKNASLLKVIQANNESLTVGIADRTMKLNKRTLDMKVMLDAMKQGVFTLSRSFEINPEYSKYLEVICLEENLGRKNIFDVFFDKSELGEDVKDQLRNALRCSFDEKADRFEWNAHLLVDEVVIPSACRSDVKHIELDWVPVVDDAGLVEKIMVIARDNSEVCRLSAESEAQRRELAMLGEIVDASAAQFTSFVDSAKNYIARNAKLIRSSDRCPEVLRMLFINMHTIKGNARTHGFRYVTDVVHEAEKYYNFLRNNEHEPWDIARLESDLRLVEAGINEYESLFKEKLASMTETDARDTFFDEVKESLESVLDLEEDFQSDYVNYLSYFVMATEAVSICSMVRPLKKSCGSIAQELGKDIPTWNVVGGELLLRPEVATLLSDALVHCVRNSVDYGIAMPDVRQLRHQDPAGRISLNAREEGDRFLLELYDDGDGLDLSELERIGRERGVLVADALSDEKIARVMFHNGVSTKDHVTVISGHGVGMSAAFDLLEQIGGTMRVEFTSPRNGDYRKFKLVFEMYADHCLVNRVHLVDFGKNFSQAS